MDKGRNREGEMCFLKWHILYHRISLTKVFSGFLDVSRDLGGEGILCDSSLLRCLLHEWELLLLSLILARLGCFALNEDVGNKWPGKSLRNMNILPSYPGDWECQSLPALGQDVPIIQWCNYPLLGSLSLNSFLPRLSFGCHDRIGNVDYVLMLFNFASGLLL